jgi:tRNA 2-thiouridine synthesizing protein A
MKVPHLVWNCGSFLANPRPISANQRRHTMDFNKEFDASGLSCPLPIVKTKKALSDMASGQVLRVISTDPGSVCDMAAFAEQTGNALLEQASENSKFVFYLKKA